MSDTQKQIEKEYRALTIKRPYPTFNQICFPAEYKLQNPQKFVGKLMAPGQPTRTLLLFHKIGAGKSCAAIQIAQRWPHAWVVLPASLVPGFKNELRTPCATRPYLTIAERAELAKLKPGTPRYREIIRTSDARIAKEINVMSFNKFVKTINGDETVYPPVLIIDEVQNIVSTDTYATYFNAILKFIQSAPPTMRVVLMSATPIFDSPRQLPYLLQLMRVNTNPPPSVPTPDELAKILKDTAPEIAVSYFGGAPAYTFPEVRRKIVKCVFGKYQSTHYKEIVAAESRANTEEDFFYTKSRQRSNIVYPDDLSPTEGYTSITRAQLTTHLRTYSAKFAEWLERVNRPGLHFTFCEYAGTSGIKILTKILKADGWTSYAKGGPGKRRFAIWTGDQTPQQKNEMRAMFNSPDNDDSGVIKLLIGSAAMKEGVSLMRVRYAHIISPYWNQSYMSQVEGRCVRYCSAKSLPKDKRRVTIFYYYGMVSAATHEPSPMISVDEYIAKRASAKQQAIDEYVAVLKRNAIDKLLFQN